MQKIVKKNHFSFKMSWRPKYLSQFDNIFLQENLIKLSVGEKKKNTITISNLGVVQVFQATFRSKSGVRVSCVNLKNDEDMVRTYES